MSANSLIKQLRDLCQSGFPACSTAVCVTMTEAADEIERLHGLTETWEGLARLRTELAAKQASIDSEDRKLLYANRWELY